MNASHNNAMWRVGEEQGVADQARDPAVGADRAVTARPRGEQGAHGHRVGVTDDWGEGRHG